MESNQQKLYERILSQLQLEEGAARALEIGFSQQDCPGVNVREVQRNNEEWAKERKCRIEEHGARILKHLRRCSRKKLPGETTNGRKQQVWCVELRQAFPSLSQAARVTGRAPSNILQAVRLGVRCGGFHWERYDPARHRTDLPAADAAATGSASDQPSSERLMSVSLKPLRPTTPAERFLRLAFP